MRYLQPFFPLMARPAVFWVGTATFAATGFLLLGLSQPDERLSAYVDAAFLSAFAIPAVGGWVGGAIIQELQGCTFVWALPSAMRRIAAGFLVSGLLFSGFVAWVVAYSPASQLGVGILLMLGLAGYSFGGSLFGLRSWWAGALSFLIVAALVARSRALAEIAARNPLATGVLAALVLLYGWLQLFRRRTVRRRYFQLANPFPGSHSLRRSVEVERHRRIHDRPRKTDWRIGYLGDKPWRWVRAGLYESYGSLDWRILPRILERFWVLGLMFAIFAWADKGDLGFAESLGRGMHGALLGSPHVPVFSEPDDRHLIVVLIIAAAGSILALRSPADLKSSMAYPLSRRALAFTTFRLGLIDTGVFFLSVFTVLFVVGHLAGWLVGYAVRFDYVPYFLHPLLATCILVPLAYWARLRLRLASYRRQENTLVALVFGVLAFVLATWLLTVVLERLFGTPLVGLFTVMALLTVSNLLYRYNLWEHFRTHDLV